MSKNRFYIGKQEMEDESLEVWVADRVLASKPEGQVCECSLHPDHYNGDIRDEKCTDVATSHSYRIDEGHVCYTYLCEPCAEAQCSEEYLADYEYPQTAGGYAVVPKHCA